MRPRRLLDSFLLLFLSISLSATAPDSVSAQDVGAPDEQPSVLTKNTDGMNWRNIGPTRGGRSVTATGVVGHPQTYYFGATGGGVWKTTDAGITWDNVTDGFLKTGSVGAVSVAESDPNVVYVGMGEHAVRGVTTSHGDGVYRSTDAGRTWTHLGLEGTRAISRIRIHPQDPDLVYVAAQGAPYGPTEDRGIYRSRDGGANWEKILYVSERAGASELAMDMTNPRILYASFWDHLRRPWVVESGGDGSGVWKSVDGGDTWEPINEGLPDLVGKIAVDVSRANPDRLYANVEAMPGEGGVFRSDDAGATWQLMTSERIVQTRSWYYMEIYADPQDEETVYVMNAPFLKSVDGGRTFTTVAVPHGDQHDLWINPADNRNMINANDGGANVSFNSGDSWSTQRNQPTAQFYRVITDNQFPYHVYGGQQDNSAIGIRSAAQGGIGWQHFYSTAGCESAYLAFDPDEPEDVFGGCYQGLIARWSRETEMNKPIMAYPFLGLGTYPSEQRFRFNWNAPIVASPHDPSVIYHAGNVVFRTRDMGQAWDVISPDLTRDEEEKQAAGGTPITNEGAGGENYNTIMYLTESAHEAGTIWVGTDDGLVHVTRDDGTNWTDVTPPDIGESIINSIEISPHDPAKVFLVVTRYKFNDFTPLVYRTRDYGANWTLVADGIEEDHWVRTVREDPVRPGLLYAGTELGVFVSMNDGDSWEKWQLNLPIVPITDLQVRNNDLVAATQGRAFWILDDLSPLQQLADEASNASLHLHTPRDAVMAPFFGGGSGVGANPPGGAQIFYLFDEAPEGLVRLDVLDSSGAVIRTYATDPEEAGDENFSELEAPSAGLNRASWDFRHEGVQGIDGYQTFGSLAGRVAAPGQYQVRLSHGDQSQTVDLTTLPDPRLDATESQYRAQEQFVAEAQTTLADLYESVRELSNISGQVGSVVENTEDHPMADTIRTAGESLQGQITDWEGNLIQRQQQTFQDVINFKNQLDAQMAALIGS
ncbi:MAG: VPS10 domain-containing protein, partial [Longimicrobiales bacterium]